MNASHLNDDDLEMIQELLTPVDLCTATILATMLAALVIIPADANPLIWSMRQFLNFLCGPNL